MASRFTEELEVEWSEEPIIGRSGHEIAVAIIGDHRVRASLCVSPSRVKAALEEAARILANPQRPHWMN